jgi:hypothetical protein
MANMSYCRFRNTLHSLGDCVGAIQDDIDGYIAMDLSPEELNALRRMVDMCKEFIDVAEEWSATSGTDL